MMTMPVTGILAFTILAGCAKSEKQNQTSSRGADTVLHHMSSQIDSSVHGHSPGGRYRGDAHMEGGTPSHVHTTETGRVTGMKTSQKTGTGGKLENGIRTIDLKAYKFDFEPSRIVVNEGDNVRIRAYSTDVTHGIDIKGYEVNKKIPAKDTVSIAFTADKAGTYHFHCSVYCGSGHERMHGELVVRER
jgi:plastocyanin